MTRETLEQHIKTVYGVAGEHPWLDTPTGTVFRHPGNRKWFALVMDVARDKLGLAGLGRIFVVNLKCDPLLIDAMRQEPGFFPAYHMNKTHWITAALDGSAEDEKILFLLDRSYELIRPKPRRRKDICKNQDDMV